MNETAASRVWRVRQVEQLSYCYSFSRRHPMQPLQVKIFSYENSPDKMPHLPHLSL